MQAFIRNTNPKLSNGNFAKTAYQKKNALRDIAVIELLFATGMRISELCSLNVSDINLYDRTILIHGKGSKERRIQIGNDDVVRILAEYQKEYTSLLETDVDIRYIQEMLVHSSINITEIYTHVAMSKQRDILTTKHPRKNFSI